MQAQYLSVHLRNTIRYDNMLRIICSEHHSEESRCFGSDPHSDQCIIIHVVIMDCVLLVGAKVLSLQGPPVK